MNLIRRFLLNLTFLALGDLAAKALMLLAFAHIARVIGTEMFGDVAFAVAFTLYFGLIVKQGLDIYAIQESARDHSIIPALGSSILGLRLVSSLGAAAALLLAIPLLGKPQPVRVLLLLYGLSLLTSAMSCQWAFLATERMKVVAVSNILAQLVFSALAIVLLGHRSQLFWIPVMQFTGELVSAVYLFHQYRRVLGRVYITFDTGAWSRVLRDSLPMGISTAMSMVMYNFDVILLGFFKPAAEVGEYSAAYKVIAFFTSLTLLYYRNLLPVVSRCKGDCERLRLISSASQKYVLLLTTPIAVGGMLLSRPVMRLIFGGDFVGGASALQILIWIVPIASSRVLLRATLLSHGLQKDNLRISLVTASINVALNILLIPSFSYMGSAAASVASELALLVLTNRCVAHEVTPLPLVTHLWRPILASLVMAFFVSWCDNAHMAVRVLGGFLVYMAAGFSLKALDMGEIRDAIGWR